MRIKYFLPVICLFSLIQVSVANAQLKTGAWRGTLRSKSGSLLPFNFDVKNIGGKQELFIHNGAERFKVTNIQRNGDSVFIHMPLFNSEFKLKFEGQDLKGNWIKHYGDHDMLMAFTAT
ncbi:MAG TPA: hypothetical protein VHC47_02055, partial [Mucilaginibacter sp.]|nr:hypothetical protein [Mucilaginibacter sp.]